MQSITNTIISLPGQSITDEAGNVWTIVNGQVAVNGVPDSTTANVIQMAYESGVVWQENADNLWWSKTSPSSQWSPPYGTSTSPIPDWGASLNDTIITAVVSAPIVDAQGNSWSISNGQVLINGVADPTTARVVDLVYSNGLLWQKNADDLWWSKSSPTSQWSPPYGTSTAPPSGNGAETVTLSSLGAPITDASGNAWAIVDSRVTLNGVVDPTTANVTELAYVNGRIWQENEDGLWWSKGKPSDQWSPAYGTPQSPVQPVTATWFGKDGAFSVAANWTPNGVPHAGDTAIVGSGDVTMANGFGTGVNFVLGGQGAEVDFKTSGNYNLGTLQGTGTIVAGAGGQDAAITSSGMHLAAGDNLLFDEFQHFGSLALHGNSTLGTGSTLTIGALGINHQPYGQLENDGVMTLDSATFRVSDLGGSGVVTLMGNSNMQVEVSAASSDTIQLQSGHLEIGGFNPSSVAMLFLAPITKFGDQSSITLDNTKATAEVFAKSSPTAGELFLYNGSKVVADLHISGQSKLFASYDPSAGSLGAVTISAHAGPHPLPILSH